MQSVSDNIMLGQLAPLGTGAFTLLLDEAALEDAVDVSLLDFDREFGGATPGAPSPPARPTAGPNSRHGIRARSFNTIWLETT